MVVVMTQPDLRVRDLSVRYGPVQAVSHVFLEAQCGQVTAVIGANGAGKSSLLRAIAGLVRPSGGEVHVGEDEITGGRPEEIVRAGVALVPEGRSTIPELTVTENLVLGALWHSRSQRGHTLVQVFDLFPALAERRHAHAATLSGGERQQLAIGRALMSKPKVLLLDEPSLGLAPMIVTQILELIQRLAEDTDLAVLLVEQNAVTALRVARRAVVLNLGRIVMTGTSEEIAADEQLRHAYLGY